MSNNPNSNSNKMQIIVAFSLILLLVVSRCTSHLWNFTAVGGIALFSAAYFSKKWMPFFIIASGMLVSDLIIGFHDQMLVVYGAYFLMIAVGFVFALTLKASRIKRFSVLLAASILFFLITNFAVWSAGVLYPLTAEGLKQSYLMGLPFFRTQLLSDIVFGFALFEVALLPATLTSAVRLKH